DKMIYKGTDPLIDSYSTFYDNEHLKSTGLEIYLREHGIRDIVVAGLATDYCIKYSVLDALELGFNVYVIIDACKGVNLNLNDSHLACEKMIQAGATLLSFSDLKDLLVADKKK
ncbi:MAG: isochorismatase family protein, partial [Parachlamydiaceae bacterium]|nr:isochorismatase family protein [Parachlamydiaceae bacterium]